MILRFKTDGKVDLAEHETSETTNMSVWEYELFIAQ